MVTGGNGYAGKSADRTGALGALMVVDDPAWTDALRQQFQPLYASTAAAPKAHLWPAARTKNRR